MELYSPFAYAISIIFSKTINTDTDTGTTLSPTVQSYFWLSVSRNRLSLASTMALGPSDNEVILYSEIHITESTQILNFSDITTWASSAEREILLNRREEKWKCTSWRWMCPSPVCSMLHMTCDTWHFWSFKNSVI